MYISQLVPSHECLVCIRMYHAALPNDYNNETLVLMEEDSRLQIIIGTVAFTFGINVRGILDSLSLRFSKTADANSTQEKGRTGRSGTQGIPRGVTFMTQAEITAAEKQLAGQCQVK
jgi:hypothetical protein